LLRARTSADRVGDLAGEHWILGLELIERNAIELITDPVEIDRP